MPFPPKNVASHTYPYFTVLEQNFTLAEAAPFWKRYHEAGLYLKPSDRPHHHEPERLTSTFLGFYQGAIADAPPQSTFCIWELYPHRDTKPAGVLWHYRHGSDVSPVTIPEETPHPLQKPRWAASLESLGFAACYLQPSFRGRGWMQQLTRDLLVPILGKEFLEQRQRGSFSEMAAFQGMRHMLEPCLPRDTIWAPSYRLPFKPLRRCTFYQTAITSLYSHALQGHDINIGLPLPHRYTTPNGKTAPLLASDTSMGAYRKWREAQESVATLTSSRPTYSRKR